MKRRESVLIRKGTRKVRERSKWNRADVSFFRRSRIHRPGGVPVLFDCRKVFALTLSRNVSDGSGSRRGRCFRGRVWTRLLSHLFADGGSPGGREGDHFSGTAGSGRKFRESGKLVSLQRENRVHRLCRGGTAAGGAAGGDEAPYRSAALFFSGGFRTPP